MATGDATVAPRATLPPHPRNRMFAVVLAGVAASVFVTVMILVMILHEAEPHHVLAHL